MLICIEYVWEAELTMTLFAVISEKATTRAYSQHNTTSPTTEQ